MTASPPSIDIAALRAWIGRTEEAEDVVTPALARRFGATLNEPGLDGASGAAAPLGVHWCLAGPAVATDALGADGHPARGGFLPPVPLSRRMWAGGQVIISGAVKIGAPVRRTSRIADVALKHGRTGPLCFVTVTHSFAEGGTPLIEERQDIVYRGPDSGEPRAAATSPAEAARWSKTVKAGPLLLFRYSALTFNGHRIHYDRRYCVEEEGYPDLVVHGPLQATLLLRFAAEIRSERPATFAFRSAAPLFDGAPFTVNAVETAAGLTLWTADAAGARAMIAEAIW